MKQELSSQLAKKNGGTVDRCDRPTDKEKAFTPFGGVSRLELLSMLLMCAGLVRPRPPGSAVLIMITPKATSGEREEGGGGRRARAGGPFPIAIDDLWSLFWFAAETPPTT